MSEDNEKQVRHTITQLLSRREHGFYELIEKLKQKGFDECLAAQVVEKFRLADLQNDERYAHAMLRNAVAKGQGRLRFVNQLKQMRIDDAIIRVALDAEAIDWYALAVKVKYKKFGEYYASNDFKTMQKQRRFLAYRGFDQDEIEYAISATEKP